MRAPSTTPFAVLAGTAVLAAALAGCGSATRQLAAAPGTTSARPTVGRGVVDDPRASKLPCLRGTGLPVALLGATDVRLGTGPETVNVHFEATPGAAQAGQIRGESEAAEVIGSALLYPGAAGPQTLIPIENCLAQGVQG